MPSESSPPLPDGKGPEVQASAPTPLPGAAATPPPPKRRGRRRSLLLVLAGLLLVWLVVAYLAMPFFWRVYARRHPSLEAIPGLTHTVEGTPGDPLNVALVGTEDQVMKAMLAAKWYPADPLTLRSALKIAGASVLSRPYEDAPVSNLYWE